MSKQDSKSTASKSKGRHTFVISVCALLVIIPTVIAIFYVYFKEDDSKLRQNMFEILLFNEDNTQIASEKVAEVDISSSPLANTFFSIVSEKKPIDTELDLNSSPNFSFTINYLENSDDYLCYFTDSYATSYISDKKGTFFSVSKKSYELFLILEYSEPVHPEAFSPDLITGDDETVIPSYVNWNYKKDEGQFIVSKSNPTIATLETYELSGAINLSFSTAPSDCIAKVYSTEKGSEELLFEGSLEELSFLKLPNDTVFKVVVEASWYKTENEDPYGDAHYEFNVILRNKAEFSVSADNIKTGDFLVITAKNVQNLSKLFYTAKTPVEMQDYTDKETTSIQKIYNFVPTFTLNGDIAQAIIPFPFDLPTTTFEFELSYGAAEQSFVIAINKTTPQNYDFSKDEKIISSVISKKGIQKIEAAIFDSTPQAQSTVFTDYDFSEPANFSSGYSCFSNIIPKNSNNSFLSFGNEYLSSSPGGQAVKVLNSGIVIKTGSTPELGNYVVIDHGLGVKTIYCGLSDINVSKGSVVSKNSSIGKSGSSPLVSSDGFLLICTVNDTIINPSCILNKNISK